MGMNNRTVLAIVALVAAAIIFAPNIQQQFSASDVAAPTAETAAAVSGGARAATVSITAFDAQADTSTQVATQIYAWKGSPSEGVLLSNGVSSTTTAATDVTGANVGETVTAVAFNESFPYPVAQESVTPTGESATLLLESHAGADTGNVAVTFFDENGDTTTSEAMSATETITLNKIRVKVNEADAAFKVAAICADLAQNTNVSDVDIQGLDKISVPERLTQSGNDYDDCWAVSPQLVADFGQYETSTVVITAGASDPVGESITFAVLDEGSYIGTDRSLKTGVEDDDPNSPSDVGLADVTASVTLS